MGNLRFLRITWSVPWGNSVILLVLVFPTDEHSGYAGFVIESLCLRSSMKTRSFHAHLSLLTFTAWYCFWFSTGATCVRAYSSFIVIPRAHWQYRMRIFFFHGFLYCVCTGTLSLAFTPLVTSNILRIILELETRFFTGNYKLLIDN